MWGLTLMWVLGWFILCERGCLVASRQLSVKVHPLAYRMLCDWMSSFLWERRLGDGVNLGFGTVHSL